MRKLLIALGVVGALAMFSATAQAHGPYGYGYAPHCPFSGPAYGVRQFGYYPGGHGFIGRPSFYAPHRHFHRRHVHRHFHPGGFYGGRGINVGIRF